MQFHYCLEIPEFDFLSSNDHITVVAVLCSLQDCLPLEVNTSSGTVGSDTKQVTGDIRYVLRSLSPFNLPCLAKLGGF